MKNGGETDVDCGGAGKPGSDGAPACAPTKACLAATDCTSSICTANKCTTPTATDHVQNGGETDVDCGGAATAGSDGAPACIDADKCVIDTDCKSTFCGTTTKRCLDGASCKTSNGVDAAGIDTCGLGEVPAGNATHESCCKSVPMPVSTTVRMDKYEITAGRMRAFINAVGPDVFDWVAGQIAGNTAAGKVLNAQIPAVARPFLPKSADPNAELNLLYQLGSGLGVFNSQQPSDEQGCYNGTGAFGDATYFQPAATLAEYDVPARAFTQAQYDAKPMNCAPNWMLAAFCAWDGGMLPTAAQQQEVWGSQRYPWGATFPYVSKGNDFTTTVNYLNDNGEFFYAFPAFPDASNNDDEAAYISAPGRFAVDKTTAVSSSGDHWMDFGADQMEMSAVDTSLGNGDLFCDYATGTRTDAACNYNTTDGNGNVTTHTGELRSMGLPQSHWMGGSWEGHQKFSYAPADEPFFYLTSYTFGLDVQYGKTNARCVRPGE